ncbi:hypothetical protein HHL23_19895 [Chryseobacterium sp. RP-3-3]|uniref:Uncharacterized protein n=1 Tax=Chryseobacterium antibioticum TaxID=2728847 RepID=A0A7Y0ARB4_9FLAO|nr:hypothetical protein [Chryseobacterium antibioticum]NML72038.1 hypothetical protein [Chryseobacterium antibioticum]
MITNREKPWGTGHAALCTSSEADFRDKLKSLEAKMEDVRKDLKLD